MQYCLEKLHNNENWARIIGGLDKRRRHGHKRTPVTANAGLQAGLEGAQNNEIEMDFEIKPGCPSLRTGQF